MTVRPNVNVNGEVRPMNDAEYTQYLIDAAPPTPTPIPTIEKMAFTRLLTSVLGDTLAQAILTTPRFLIVLASAANMDYKDVFDVTDDGAPGYAKQLVLGGVVTQQQSDAFEAAWPRTT